ncbi:MAG: type I restriction endonuclease subunit M [Halobellus sp.]|uniref:type I restriction endonuclease subunit M n=1 Tax=Halobellus sp. TaxID=1979212 RepID=UPI0035D400E6
MKESLDATKVKPTFDAWKQYVRDRHGDVFAAVTDSTTDTGSVAVDPEASTRAVARELFVETLTFDYLLVRLLESIEDRYDCAVTRPLATDAAIQFDPEFETVHTFVRSRLGPDRSLNDVLDRVVPAVDPGAVADLHRACVSPAARRAFGRYDTPPGLATLAVEEGLRTDRDSDEPITRETAKGQSVLDDNESVPLVLDPGCGTGAFLDAAITRLLDQGRQSNGEATDDEPAANSSLDVTNRYRLQEVVDAVRGFDVSPTAVRASRLAVALAVRPLLERIDGPVNVRPRVVLGDVVETTVDDPPLAGRRADVLVANPPWLTWDGLSERVKSQWREGPIADPSLDLFNREGVEARLGYANDDLSVPYAWVCLDRYLRDGGRAAVVLKRDLLTGPAGERIRRQELGGRPIIHNRVHDFGSLSPFPGVDAGTALFSFDVGADSTAATTADGVPTIRWSPRGGDADPRSAAEAAESTSIFDSLQAMRASFDQSSDRLVPANPAEPTSAWIRSDAERRVLGESAYRIRHGVKDDAKAVFSLDRETIDRHEIEPTHVYPYLKSRHIVKYGLFGYGHHLVPQRRAGEDNEADLRRETPATYAYLDAHRQRLVDRGSSWFDGGPFYSLFGLGPYTWTEYKVVWCRLGFKPHFAVVSSVTDPLLGEKPVVPGDHCMFVGTDDEREAHYLCGLLNSAPYQRCLRDISSGGKSSLSKSTVGKLALPEWSAAPQQLRLAELSSQAHDIVPEHVDCSKRTYNQKTIPELESVQAEIDRTTEAILGSRSASEPRETK